MQIFMQNTLRNPVRIILILGYGFALWVFATGLFAVFGPPYDAPEEIGRVVGGGFSKMFLAGVIALAFWCVFEKLVPWMFQQRPRT